MNKKAILEGLLFVSGDEGISFKNLKEILSIDETELKKLIEDLSMEYDKEDRGIKLENFGNNLKLTTKKEHKEFYERFLDEEDSKFLTQAALETLAIVAYNGPITRVELDEIRGISCSHMIRRLISKNLIKECGKSDLPGRPTLYEVTEQFLDYFGLSTIEDLPKIEELKSDDSEKDLFESKYKEQ
ncbi:MAG: SMC-Scp complex subunit ScpB [Bacilli bacterium]|nr:SMC-Scp complex subunit ScpB [Bacilli bacterium]